jgi:hypothetical protein
VYGSKNQLIPHHISLECVDSLGGGVVPIASLVAMVDFVEALPTKIHQHVESVLAWTKKMR